MESLATVDRDLFYLINHGWANGFLDRVFPWITRLGNFWPIIAALVAWLVWRGGARGRTTLLAVALSISITDPVTVRVLKPAFHRERPCTALEDTRLLASRKSSPSFPSAHAVNAFAVATVFAGFYASSLVIALPLAIAVGLSRVYIGVHYPFDVLAGAVLGTLIGSAVLGVLRLSAARVPWLVAPRRPFAPALGEEPS